MRNLTAVSNNAGSGQLGLGACGLPNLASHRRKQVHRFVGKLLHTGQIGKMISSFIGGFILLIYYPPRSDS